LRRALAGDDQSLERAAAVLFPLITCQARLRLSGRLARRLAPEDLVAQTWSVFLEKLRGGALKLTPRDGRLTPVVLKYLSSVLHNVYRDRLKAALRSPEITAADARHDARDPGASAAADLTSVSAAAMRDERASALAAALDRLPRATRELVVLRAVEQLPYRDIAPRLGLTENLASTRYARALVELRAYLTEGMADELSDP
jgi:RNA polymerase sigma factor (sigma-70 family)